MKYAELIIKHETEFSEFPKFFAFNDNQITEGMEDIGISDINDTCRIFGGGFIRKADSLAFEELIERHQEEMETHMKDREFLVDAIVHELGEHEFGYTGDIHATVSALGLSLEESLLHSECLIEAISIYRRRNSENL